ncbi:MAG: hypothetical protein E7043_04145 [Lentisphaerae bacterium]|nr:hypothetical protein [Lentisphaerota bacterium]
MKPSVTNNLAANGGKRAAAVSAPSLRWAAANVPLQLSAPSLRWARAGCFTDCKRLFTDV